MNEREKKLEEALKTLVDMYVANKGSKSEFICCITPIHSRDLTFNERRSNPVWKAWDNAREALGEFDE